MKLAHIADSHLGIRQYHRQTSGGINQREADVAAAFKRAIDRTIAAVAEKNSAATEEVSASAIAYAEKCLSEPVTVLVHVFVIVGSTSLI